MANQAPVLTGTPGDKKATLSWTNVSAQKYKVQRLSGGSWNTLSSQAALTFIDQPLTNGQSKKYRVKAIFNTGADKLSNEVTVTPYVTPALGAPTLSGTAGQGSTSLSWTMVSGATGYQIRRAIGANQFSLLAETTALVYSDTGLTNGLEYHYRVIAFNAAGSGPASNTVDLTPAAPAISAAVGYGAAVTGGDGGTVYNVSTWAQLKTALEASGARIVNLIGNGLMDGSGGLITIANGDLTLDGSGYGRSFKSGWLKVKGPISNIIFRELRIRPGDVDTGDADAIGFNAADGDIDGVLIDHCSLMWGPDIGGVSLLGYQNGGLVKNVTIQNSIVGPGMYYSNAGPDSNPTVKHAKALNIATQPSGEVSLITNMSSISPGSVGVTLYRNLITGGVERVPQAHYADNLDWINNIIYNWEGQGMEGNPRGLNAIGNVTKKGPRTRSGALLHFHHTPKPAHTPYPASVYVSDPICIGFLYKDNISASARRTTPHHGGPFNVTAIPGSQVYDSVLATVGPTVRDVVDEFVVNSVKNGTDNMFFGVGLGTPNPYWP